MHWVPGVPTKPNCLKPLSNLGQLSYLCSPTILPPLGIEKFRKHVELCITLFIHNSDISVTVSDVYKNDHGNKRDNYY